jgi:hypothetical protein
MPNAARRLPTQGRLRERTIESRTVVVPDLRHRLWDFGQIARVEFTRGAVLR